MIKEALALNKSELANSRIVAKVDNQAVVFAWTNQYSKNDVVNQVLEDIY